MVETLFTWKRIKTKHLQAPLLKERQQFLTYLLNEGVSLDRIRTIATMLLHVIRLMKFNQIRAVERSEILCAEELWKRDITEAHTTRKVGPTLAESFHYAALHWLTFLKVIPVSEPSSRPIDLAINDFNSYMTERRGMSPHSIRVYGSRIKRFLEWNLSRGGTISSICLRDVDEYLQMEQRRGRLPRTIGSHCVALRLFLRYAEMRGWSEFNFARGIKNPRVPRYDPSPKSPPWAQVRRLLDAEVPRKQADLRASAILFLCAIYLYQLKNLLAKTGRNGRWTSFLEGAGIARATADRYVESHKRFLDRKNGNRLTEAISVPAEDEIKEMVAKLTPRLVRVLTTPESISDFLREMAAALQPSVTAA